jgi:excisionase family DNA binding protein
MIELTVKLTDEQLAEIAARAAALIPTGTPAVSPWLNVLEAAERLRCRKDRIYDLIALGKLQPRRDGRRVLLHRDDLDAYVEGRHHDRHRWTKPSRQPTTLRGDE